MWVRLWRRWATRGRRRQVFRRVMRISGLRIRVVGLDWGSRGMRRQHQQLCALERRTRLLEEARMWVVVGSLTPIRVCSGSRRVGICLGGRRWGMGGIGEETSKWLALLTQLKRVGG